MSKRKWIEMDVGISNESFYEYIFTLPYEHVIANDDGEGNSLRSVKR